jgi:hypothetical protein
MKKKKRWVPKVGDKVTIPWWEYRYGAWKATRVRNLTGKIISIDGGYHYVKIKGNPKYDVIVLYSVEFKKKPKRRKK